MDYERYELMKISADALECNFISSGPNGKFPIIVQFTETDNPDVYNLSFGNVLKDGELDDLVKNNNSDRNKILATVAGAVFEFTSRNPGKKVFFSGSTVERTRLYRMAITVNLEILGRDFEVYGVYLIDRMLWIEPFKRNSNYYGFMVIRKNN